MSPDFHSATAARAEDKKPAGPVTLTLVAKTDEYKFDGGGKTPTEYKKYLEGIADQQKGGKPVTPPKPPAVDLVLMLTNTTKEDVTIYVGGDPNTYTFELTGGAGAVTLNSGLAFTADFKLPKAVTLGAGKTHEIPVKVLADGLRGAARNVYWTGPGEYKLSAKYTLSDAGGRKGAALKSEPVKITVTEK
ncbi:MAG: hypothetical protein J0I06_13195 [Planctomycetes bacterium]|nr:hypothetical protein [Planctomycetota bacterium]